MLVQGYNLCNLPFCNLPFLPRSCLEIMLKEASIQNTARLTQIKDSFGEVDVAARFAWLATVNVTWYLWWLDHEPRGWALIAWDGKSSAPTYPDIFDLYVHRDWRGQGIGQQILHACEQIVRNAGHSKIGLAVNPDLNPRAYRFYQRLGYAPLSQDKYLDGVYNGVEDWVIDLEKNFKPP
jgi:GNAT superfamily N-acetyltransferase